MSELPRGNLEKILNRFRMQDISNIALHVFPEITWEEIYKQINKSKNVTLTIKNVIKTILNSVKDLTDHEINERTSKLTLYYIGNTERRTWHSFHLTNKIDHYNEKNNKLEAIKSSVRRQNFLADINMVKFNNKYVISVVKKIIRKRGGITRQEIIFLQYFLHQPYLFISKKSFDIDLILAVTNGLGYKSCAVSHLNGPNVQDLLTILRNKDGGVISADLIETKPNLEPSVRMSKNSINYSQNVKRRKYSEQIFGVNPPKLQQISITVKDDTWNTSNGFSAMEGTSLNGMELTISAPNVAEFLKECIAQGVVTSPVPLYIENILTTGKNHFKINPIINNEQ